MSSRISRVRVAVCASTFVLAASGCKTGGETSSSVQSDQAFAGEPSGIPDGAQGLPFPGGQPDFCVSDATTRQDLANWTPDLWAQAFANGIASAQLIPSADHPGVVTPGKGFPRIFSQFIANKTANRIWDGKTMHTTEDGQTRLVNRFVQAGEDFSIDLFTAKVVIDPNSKLRNSDGKPVILLDYRESKLTEPASGLGKINELIVPVIKAIRDEIRLVCQTTENGVRRRLYLGPTFLLPEEFATTAGKKLAKKFEIDPLLWFALEYEEPAE